MVRGGESRARVYHLTSGELEDWITAEGGDMFFKIGLVPFQEFSDLVRTREGHVMGAPYSLEASAWLWRHTSVFCSHKNLVTSSITAILNVKTFTPDDLYIAYILNYNWLYPCHMIISVQQGQ